MNSYLRTQFQTVSRKAMACKRNENNSKSTVMFGTPRHKMLGTISKEMGNSITAAMPPVVMTAIQKTNMCVNKLAHSDALLMSEERPQNQGAMEKEQIGTNPAVTTSRTVVAGCAQARIVQEGWESWTVP